jgi:predicted CoA-substrate-specific enzyme activase
MRINNFQTGIDVGSTTLKVIVLDHNSETVYKNYVRHKADVNAVLLEELKKIHNRLSIVNCRLSITGSAGMGVAERLHLPYIQEVISSIEVIKRRYPSTRTLIDLGGEDAKIVFFEEGSQPDIRMNGSCAGGTGAFIDQMADLMNITVQQLGETALDFRKIYPIASRCGVFAKTDVQNLLSRNIPQPDMAMSILHTVVLQAITTLVRGRRVQSEALCIGGPLTFIPALRERFKHLLNLQENEIVLPENSEYFPAWGCAFLAQNNADLISINDLIQKLSENKGYKPADSLPSLFENERKYLEWKEKRDVKHLKFRELQDNETFNCFGGIDSGSTTTKILILDGNENIVFTYYASNQGNPLKKVIEGMNEFFQKCRKKNITARIIASCSTGYGEELVKSALNLDYGIVETMAHLSGAQWVNPEVSFVLDIGGQDMKSIFVRNGVISNVELNEACSSGCGSFLQNFSATMNLEMNDFVKKACLSKSPADLGTRCTVFMNSKVKQSLRENATIGDIAAGLAYSVVKNCLFKVLKIGNLNVLGENIVVQGGTFRNDAVYRALELLSGKSVSSTDMPEIMGALGAALYAKKTKNYFHDGTY